MSSQGIPRISGWKNSTNLLRHSRLLVKLKTRIQAASRHQQIYAIAYDMSQHFTYDKAIPKPVGGAPITGIIAAIDPHFPKGKTRTIATAIRIIYSENVKFETKT